MHIKTIVAGAALALAATIGSASAAEQFSTLKGITAEALTPQEMGIVVGQGIGHLIFTLPGGATAATSEVPNGQLTGKTVNAPDARAAVAFDLI